jgi:hypothetical protein
MQLRLWKSRPIFLQSQGKQIGGKAIRVIYDKFSWFLMNSRRFWVT